MRDLDMATVARVTGTPIWELRAWARLGFLTPRRSGTGTRVTYHPSFSDLVAVGVVRYLRKRHPELHLMRAVVDEVRARPSETLLTLPRTWTLLVCRRDCYPEQEYTSEGVLARVTSSYCIPNDADPTDTSQADHLRIYGEYAADTPTDGPEFDWDRLSISEDMDDWTAAREILFVPLGEIVARFKAALGIKDDQNE